MTVVEHLTELRRRLVIALSAVVVGSIAGWFLFQQTFGLFRDPYCDALAKLPATVRPPQGCALIFTGIPDAFLMRLKLAVFTGFAFALPVVLYELWMFITPGLTKRERRLALPFVLSSVGLFALGAWFAFLTLPKGLQFLLGFGGELVVPFLTVDRYVGFVTILILVFGLSFEFPLLLIFLAGARVITSAQMRRWRRGAWLGSAIAAAVLTPSQDPYTMLAMMVPLIVFYELSVLVARLFKR